MLSAKMKVNKNLLPIKGHFFLFNAGTAPLVPYLSTYARQLGFTPATVGLIYTILPIFGLIAKPLFGVIADRFKKQKSIFILFQIVTIVSFSAIYFIPGNTPSISVELDCNDGITVLKSCANNSESLDTCKIDSLGNMNETALCKMNCDMTSPNMWQTVCEHWGISQYCYNDTNTLRYSTKIGQTTVKEDNCIYLISNNVTLDGYEFTPRCGYGKTYVDINEPCDFDCTNEQLSSLLMGGANMICSDNILNYRSCESETATMTLRDYQNSECSVKCDINKAWKLREICDGWQADVTQTCQTSTMLREQLPSNLSFVGSVLLHTMIPEHNCAFVRLQHITLPDGSVYYPNCISQAQYQTEQELFHASCEINCDNAMLNEVFQAASESNLEETSQYNEIFWLFFSMMIISWIGQAVVVTFADAICFNLLGDKVSEYGKQRLWGSVGWGIFSLTTGALIDMMSDGAYKDYKIAFILMFIFMSGDVIVSCFLKTNSTVMSMNILADVGSLLTSLPTFVFMMWTIAVGLCTGLLWQFLFWHLEDVAMTSCDGANYIKTLQGLVSAIQTFGGEIPFLFVSGIILKKIGHTNMMTLVLFAFGVRFILYSFLTNAWWVLPVEMLQGITFGMFYPTMTSYASVLSPPGAETTVQGLVGAIFEGVGTSLGSFIGGQIYGRYGGWTTFRMFGIGALICCLIHLFIQCLLKRKTDPIKVTGTGYVTVKENDIVDTAEEIDVPLDYIKSL